MNDQNVNQGPNFDNFEEEQVGFPPYWKAGWVRPPKGDYKGEGKWFYAKVISFDGRDPEFERWVLEAGMDLECATGPTDDQELVTVKKGQQFSVSAYGGLPLERYFGVYVRVQVKGTQDTGKPSAMFVFGISVSPETKKLLGTPKYQAQLAVAQRAMRALPASQRSSKRSKRSASPNGETSGIDDPSPNGETSGIDDPF